MSKVIFYALISFVVLSCSEKNNQKKFKLLRQDSSYTIFSKAKNESDIFKKLELLELASRKIKSKSDTLLFDILDYQIYYNDIQKNYNKSLYYSNLMINNAIKAGDSANLAKGYYRKAKVFLYLDKHELVLRNMYRSQSIYKAIGDSTNTGRRLVELANAQDRLGDFIGSHQSATEALKFLPETDSVYRASSYNLIALTSSELNDFDETIIGNNTALKYARSKNDSLIIYNNIALNFKNLGDYAKADEILTKSLQQAEKNSRIELRLADNYYFNQYLHTAQNIKIPLERVKNKRIEIGDVEGLLTSYNHLSTFYKDTKSKESQKIAEEYLKLSREFGNPLNELESLKILISLNNGNDIENYTSRYFIISDSIMKARNKIKNVFAKIKYDEEQKINQIENLELVSAGRKLALANEKSQKTIILFILIILVLVSLFTSRLIMQKHKKDKIKEVYSTEARLSKKVHDELANDLFLIMNDLSGKDQQILHRLENVYNRTRDISKENNLINTSESFADELRGIISSTITSDAKIVLNGFQEIKWDFYKKEQKIVIYRTVQELLVNFRKHSQANILVLKFEEEKSKIKITYKDNGIGVDLERKNFSGLKNMENRIDSIGGNITFQSEIQNGFQSIIYIPI